MIGDANIITILVAAALGIVVGAVWYSPKVFGAAGMKQSNMNGKTYFMTFISNVVTAYVLAYFIGAPGMASVGAVVGFWAWLGFVAPVNFGAVLWGSKPMRYFWINTLHHLVTLVVMGMAIAAWS